MFNSQKELFTHLYETVTDRTCMICGYATDMKKAYCYAHILDKGLWKKLKCVENNIGIVCSIDCHNKLDKIAKGSANEIYKQISQGKSAKDIINYLKCNYTTMQ